ncbi:MAG: hypothetical protein ACE365_01575 [Gammaproteobacteria bacterium]
MNLHGYWDALEVSLKAFDERNDIGFTSQSDEKAYQLARHVINLMLIYGRKMSSFWDPNHQVKYGNVMDNIPKIIFGTVCFNTISFPENFDSADDDYDRKIEDANNAIFIARSEYEASTSLEKKIIELPEIAGTKSRQFIEMVYLPFVERFKKVNFWESEIFLANLLFGIDIEARKAKAEKQTALLEAKLKSDLFFEVEEKKAELHEDLLKTNSDSDKEETPDWVPNESDLTSAKAILQRYALDSTHNLEKLNKSQQLVFTLSAANKYLSDRDANNTRFTIHGKEKTESFVRHLMSAEILRDDFIRSEAERYIEGKGIYSRLPFFQSGASKHDDKHSRRHFFVGLTQ